MSSGEPQNIEHSTAEGQSDAESPQPGDPTSTWGAKGISRRDDRRELAGESFWGEPQKIKVTPNLKGEIQSIEEERGEHAPSTRTGVSHLSQWCPLSACSPHLHPSPFCGSRFDILRFSPPPCHCCGRVSRPDHNRYVETRPQQVGTGGPRLEGNIAARPLRKGEAERESSTQNTPLADAVPEGLTKSVNLTL